MSIQSQIRKVKQEVKCYGFWRKTSTATTKESVSKYIMSYVDETSKADALAESRKLGYTAVQFGKPDPVEQGIGYLSKEEKGRIRVFGFLRDDVEKLTGRQPNHLSNDDRVIACHRAWMRGSSSTGVKSSPTSLCSASAGFCELMTRAGKDCDALLVRGLEPSSAASRNTTLGTGGFLLGIHHDRQHVHAHILPDLAESGRHEGHRQ